jgi:drug/metabolite transporter (DMT)-like permease
MQWGDILTLIAGVLFGLHILIIKRYTKEVHPITWTLWQFIFTAIYAFMGTLLFEDIMVVTTISSSVLLQILYLSIFATTITLLCQSIGQEMISVLVVMLLF